MPRSARPLHALGLSAALWLAGCAASSTSGSTSGSASAPASAPVVMRAPSIDQAAALASACSGCHRPGGRAIADLQGRSAQQIEQSLLAYKNAVDGPSAMHRMARGYSDSEIAAVARQLGR